MYAILAEESLTLASIQAAIQQWMTKPARPVSMHSYRISN